MTPLLDWEIEPGCDNGPDYAIWRDRNAIAIASQTETWERFHLETPQEVDELIDRLRRARAWLVGE